MLLVMTLFITLRSFSGWKDELNLMSVACERSLIRKVVYSGLFREMPLGCGKNLGHFSRNIPCNKIRQFSNDKAWIITESENCYCDSPKHVKDIGIVWDPFQLNKFPTFQVDTFQLIVWNWVIRRRQVTWRNTNCEKGEKELEAWKGTESGRRQNQSCLVLRTGILEAGLKYQMHSSSESMKLNREKFAEYNAHVMSSLPTGGHRMPDL